MKDMRILGNHIQQLAQDESKSEETICSLLNCTALQLQKVYKGLLFPTFEQLESLAEYFVLSVDALLDGNQAHYESTVVHCMGEFDHAENREMILDIIEDYLKLQSVVAE